MTSGLYRRIMTEGIGNTKSVVFYWLDEKNDRVLYYLEQKKSWTKANGHPEEWSLECHPPLNPSYPLEFLLLTGHHFEAPL